MEVSEYADVSPGAPERGLRHETRTHRLRQLK
jgi:hypothetical protein